jgi:hypothetical protein
MARAAKLAWNYHIDHATRVAAAIGSAAKYRQGAPRGRRDQRLADNGVVASVRPHLCPPNDLSTSRRLLCNDGSVRSSHLMGGKSHQRLQEVPQAAE